MIFCQQVICHRMNTFHSGFCLLGTLCKKVLQTFSWTFKELRIKKSSYFLRSTITYCVLEHVQNIICDRIFIQRTSMSSSPLCSLRSQRLAHRVTILHCLLEEKRPRHTEFTVRTQAVVTMVIRHTAKIHDSHITLF